MMQFVKYIVLVFVAFLLGCTSSKVVVEKSSNQTIVSSQLSELINAQPSNENSLYSSFQSKEAQFKSSAPFVEIIKDSYEERLWFTSSKFDSLYDGNIKTNNYQQIYYAQRSIYNSLCALDGWENVSRLEVESTTLANRDKAADFNKASKGAPTIAGNTLILACDQFDNENQSEFKDLWKVTIDGDRFVNPFRLNKLSGQYTWESQPTLSADGKHLFFVSNRRVDADTFAIAEEQGTDLNIYYSYNNIYGWTAPKLVKEIYSTKNEITPSLNSEGNMLYFASDRGGNSDIYAVKVALDSDKGGYEILSDKVEVYDPILFTACADGLSEVVLNDDYKQSYPFAYYNPKNLGNERALYWVSDQPSSKGSATIYAASMPKVVDVYVSIIEEDPIAGKPFVKPIMELTGDKNSSVNDTVAHFKLFVGEEYQILGGSLAKPFEDINDSSIYKVYNWIGYADPTNEETCDDLHLQAITGAVLQSEKTKRYGAIPLNESVLYDTIRIAKAWDRQSPCPDPYIIKPSYSSIPYFQSGYWRVNTSENLNEDLEELHSGFQITGNLPITNPRNGIIRYRSDYTYNDFSKTLFMVRPRDGFKYSIANANWIELHPNNYYWGDHPYYSWVNADRMKGRIDRIQQYYEYAEKVDENLTEICDTIVNKYLDYLQRQNNAQILIEVLAISDQRRLTDGWYIGDTVQYRESEYVMQGLYDTREVCIVPPKVDELRKHLTILPFSYNLNDFGNNGSILGNALESDYNNTNLSRLRAFYGYQEIYKRLIKSELFNEWLAKGLIALPDNDVAYDDAKVIFIVNSKNVDVIDPNQPFPAANNQNQQGFYDYDEVRRIEVQVRTFVDDPVE